MSKATADRVKVTITVDDVEYPLYLDEITPRVELELYQATGLSVQEIMVAELWPSFMIASVVWLSRRVRGERVTWDQVADQIDASTEVSRVVGDVEAASAPKVPAGSSSDTSPN